jgi:hypothetical protein
MQVNVGPPFGKGPRNAQVQTGSQETCLYLATLRSLPDIKSPVVALASPVLEAGESQPGPQVKQFTPQGTIKRVRQASARFAEPMVTLGDPRSPVDPFEIDCSADGVGRWVDSHTWVYDFARDLPGGIRCRFQLRPGLVTQAGEPVTGQTTFTFTTGVRQSRLPSPVRIRRSTKIRPSSSASMHNRQRNQCCGTLQSWWRASPSGLACV